MDRGFEAMVDGWIGPDSGGVCCVCIDLRRKDLKARSGYSNNKTLQVRYSLPQL